MTAELSRKEWLARRRKYLGGSDAASALGISRFKSRLQLCQDKWGELEDKPTEAMERGRILEPLVVYMYGVATGDDIEPGSWLASDEHDFMAATPDIVNKTLDKIVQAKTASTWGRHKWGESGTDEIPDDYVAQAHHEMCVTGSDGEIFAVLFADEATFRGLVFMAKAGLSVEKMADFVNEMIASDNSKCEFAIYSIDRSEAFIKTLVDGERNFWDTYIVPHVSPPDASIPEKTTDIVTADLTQSKILEQLREADEAVAIATVTYDEWRAQVETMIGANAGVSANGIGKVTFKAPSPKKKTDHEAVSKAMKASDPDAHAVFVKKYTTTTQAKRRFLKAWEK